MKYSPILTYVATTDRFYPDSARILGSCLFKEAPEFEEKLKKLYEAWEVEWKVGSSVQIVHNYLGAVVQSPRVLTNKDGV